MSASKSSAKGLPPLVSMNENSLRFVQVMNALRQTRKISVLCCEATSRDCGLPLLEEQVDLQFGSETRRTSLVGLLRDCSPEKVSPDLLDPRLLKNLNRAMAARRLAAADLTLPGTLHHWLATLSAAGKLTGCFTTSFDGLESRGHSGIEGVMVGLYGDNRVLRCCQRGCSGTDEEQTAALQDELLNPFVDGESAQALGPTCTSCMRKYKKASLAKRRGNDKTMQLRPAVQTQLSASIVGGDLREQMLAISKQSKLLVIMDATFKGQPGEMFDLVRALADAVHAASGAVLYVSETPLRGRNVFDFVDMQLRVNPDEFMRQAMEAQDKLTSDEGGADLFVYEDEDFWFDVVSNELPAMTADEELVSEGLACDHCLCNVAEYLVGCQNCDAHFCYRRVNYNESPDAELGADGKVKPIDVPAEGDSLPLEDACIVLNQHSPDGRRPPLAQAKSEFVCPECWRYDDRGLYPHFVKPVPRLRAEKVERRWPRLAVVIFYVEQFWTIAKHMMRLVSGRWANKGWACTIEAVKLEHMSERQSAHETLTWEAGSYSLFVVYLTHGLTGDQGYQLAQGKSLPPAQFMHHTLSVAERVRRNARETRGFLFSCGHPLHHSGLVDDLNRWVQSAGTFDTLLGVMNTRFSPSYALNLVARLSTLMVDPDTHANETMFQCWLTDSLAAHHTDILCLSVGSRPTLWLYAPFQSRPLGKPLPSIMAICHCGIVSDERRELRRANSRKTWEVDHNGRDGIALNRVSVKATCTLCRQRWPLFSDHLVGTLRKHSGLYAALVPYFVEPADRG